MIVYPSRSSAYTALRHCVKLRGSFNKGGLHNMCDNDAAAKVQAFAEAWAYEMAKDERSAKMNAVAQLDAKSQKRTDNGTVL